MVSPCSKSLPLRRSSHRPNPRTSVFHVSSRMPGLRHKVQSCFVCSVRAIWCWPSDRFLGCSPTALGRRRVVPWPPYDPSPHRAPGMPPAMPGPPSPARAPHDTLPDHRPPDTSQSNLLHILGEPPLSTNAKEIQSLCLNTACGWEPPRT